LYFQVTLSKISTQLGASDNRTLLSFARLRSISMDMPELEAIIIESNEPNGPFGAKEVGEGAIMPTIPAILSPRRTIYDATGVYIDELPVTPEKMLRAIRAKVSS